MSTTYLIEIGAARATIDAAAYRLQSLSRSFATTGNPHVADLLTDIRIDLEESSKRIGVAGSNELTNTLKAAQDNSRAILGAVMAGIVVGKPTLPAPVGAAH